MLQRSRILAVATLMVVLVLFLGLGAWLFTVQIVKRSQYIERARDFQYKRIRIAAPRGSILDQKGEILATCIPALEVWAASHEIDKPWTRKNEAEETALLLAPLVSKEAQKIYDTFSQQGYHPLNRMVTDPNAILELYRLKRKGFLRGVYLEKKYCRRYPHGELLGHNLGYVNHEGKGVCGVESLRDDFLSESPGRRVFERDGVQNKIFSTTERQIPGLPGGKIFLTVDTAIQLFAEIELAKIDRLYRPKWAAAVVLEPSSGRILAAANFPPLDPSSPAKGGPGHWINRVFSAEYTPGSSFKPLMMALALDRGVVNLHESIDCEGGAWSVKGRCVRDVHVNYRMLDAAGILIHSSNIGMAKITLRLVPESTDKGGPAFKPIRDTLHLLGLGKAPGVFPAGLEARGKVTPLKNWSRIYTLVSLSFGNEISVTPIQMAAAFGVLANGGLYVPPRLVERMVSPDGREITPPRAPTRRIFSQDASQTLKEMLVRVVEEGSGKKARIEGISIAGKTGTAEKLPERKEVTSSFIAFAPSEQPALVVLVVVDEPQGAHYASTVAAPHVKALLERGLYHLGVLCKTEEDISLNRES